MSKIRLDMLLVERNLAETREKAKRLVMAGVVFSGEVRLDKPGVKVNQDIEIEVKGKLFPYVGRGGLKLEKALDYFNIDVNHRTMIDIGASTGGFTDCGLQNGVRLCYAIDVGYNQLDWKLRSDDRVIVMERTNFRYVTPDMLKFEQPNFASIDVSFISLKLILPTLKTLLAENSDIVALIKPQFEAGRDQVGKKGIVRDAEVHEQVITEIVQFAKELDFQIIDLTFSPITGGEGNIEFLVHLGWKKTGIVDCNFSIQQIVNDAHHYLK